MQLRNAINGEFAAHIRFSSSSIHSEIAARRPSQQQQRRLATARMDRENEAIFDWKIRKWDKRNGFAINERTEADLWDFPHAITTTTSTTTSTTDTSFSSHSLEQELKPGTARDETRSGLTGGWLWTARSLLATTTDTATVTVTATGTGDDHT